MIRLTGVGQAQDAPVLVDESVIRFVGPTASANAETMILQQDSDEPIIVRETVDQIEQLVKDVKKIE